LQGRKRRIDESFWNVHAVDLGIGDVCREHGNGIEPGKWGQFAIVARPPAGSGVIIVSSSDGYSWRAWPAGKIEFSYDSSHTSEAQKSGVTADLIAGASPSGKVCWIVGKSGTILLTTDKGKHWKQLPSPTKEDLVGTYAQDGKRASVWTASHQKSFETNDGGATWTANVEK
jgi:hypothetical protein